MATDRIAIGTKRVYPVNPDSIEHNTAYQGSEFNGNCLVMTEEAMVGVNGTEGVLSPKGEVVLISDNYYYQFFEELLIIEAIVQLPNLGVSESTVVTTNVELPKNVETEIVSHTLSDAIGEIQLGSGTFELSCTFQNTEGQDAKVDINVYVNGSLVGSELDFIVPKNDGVANLFYSSDVGITLAANSVLTAKVSPDKVCIALADITMQIRKGT